MTSKPAALVYFDDHKGPVNWYRSTLRPASELMPIPALLIRPGAWAVDAFAFETYEPLDPAWMAHMDVTEVKVRA